MKVTAEPVVRWESSAWWRYVPACVCVSSHVSKSSFPSHHFQVIISKSSFPIESRSFAIVPLLAPDDLRKPVLAVYVEAHTGSIPAQAQDVVQPDGAEGQHALYPQGNLSDISPSNQAVVGITRALTALNGGRKPSSNDST